VIYDNCTIFTLDAERRILTGAALAVDGTTIAAVGKSADVRAARQDDDVRDLNGWLVVPGMVDGHLHLPQAMLRGSADDVPPPVAWAGRFLTARVRRDDDMCIALVESVPSGQAGTYLCSLLDTIAHSIRSGLAYEVKTVHDEQLGDDDRRDMLKALDVLAALADKRQDDIRGIIGDADPCELVITLAGMIAGTIAQQGIPIPVWIETVRSGLLKCAGEIDDKQVGDES